MTQVHEYAIKRILSAIPVLFIVSFTIVALIRMVPGDPAVIMLGTDADPEQLAALRESMGLNQPLYIQYIDYMSGVVRGDFGYSYMGGQSVTDAILQRLPITISVAIGGFIVSLAIAIPAGTISAVKQDTSSDYAALTFGLLGVSIPNFWLGIMLLMVFAVWFGWFPVTGYVSPLDDPIEGIRYLVLPSITLGTAMAAIVTRMLRSEMLEEIRMEYPDSLRMKGVSEMTVLRHVMKNAFIPVITVIGMQVGYLLGGTIVIEEVFSIPGMGRLLLDAIYSRDYMMLQGVVLVYTAMFIAVNAIVDITYFYLNPKLQDR
ncbi:ABC transporter permease [Natronosalvus vescus]|uniref:ABC transporter permease n=1 Tax=Natronosalvus vescus TaxID=2953881 RepID=UPI0020905C1D|nr:ABC transporter permease [Natronosalvus vescus]